MALAGAQYLLPDGAAAERIKEVLASGLELVDAGRAKRVDRTFYDTFDGRLHEAGLTLVHDGDRLALVDANAYGERAGVVCPAAPPTVFARDLPAAVLRDLLEPIVEMRALAPVARIRSRQLTMGALNGDEKTVARLVLEEASAEGAARKRIPLRPRLHVVPLRGYGKAALRVQRTVESDLKLAAASRPLHDEAVAATGGVPGGTKTKLELELRYGARADAAASLVLGRLTAIVEANVGGTLADVDSEFLHDLRVAVRRIRSLQRELKAVFPSELLAGFRQEFRWLQQVTGPVRDLDVYLLDFEQLRCDLPAPRRADLDPLAAVLSAHRARERRKLVRTLRSKRMAGLLESWSTFVETLESLPDHDRPGASRPIGELAGARIRTVYGRMVKMGRVIDDGTPAEALHSLRKVGKELRYLLEFFGKLYPEEVARPMVKTLKALQDTLGTHNDCEIQADMLRSCRDEVAARDGGAAALMAMGLVTDRLERKQAEARSDFAARFSAFAAAPQRKLVKAAFR